MGDDSLIIDNRTNKVYEIDYSSFDNSQAEGS